MCLFSSLVIVVLRYQITFSTLLTISDCDNLTDPSNGQVTHSSRTTLGQTATYSCNTGYNLVGDSTRTCQDTGEWSGSAPTCQGMLLKVISFLPYVYIHSKHADM